MSYQTETCGLHDCPPEGCRPMPMSVALTFHEEIDRGLGIAPRKDGDPVRFVTTSYGPDLHEVPEWWTL